MRHTSTPLFDEVIQMATPHCINGRDMTLVRKLKTLQEYTEKLEQLIDQSHEDVKSFLNAVKS
jgi:hypothetical protein